MDTFTYTVSDGRGGSATGTVSVAIAAVNDAPVAVDHTLLKHRERATGVRAWEQLGLHAGVYGAVTLHRPSNVDHAQTLAGIVAALEVVQQRLPLVFPVHLRTRKMAETFGLWARIQGWQ